MRIEKIYLHDPNVGWIISIKEFSKEDFKRLHRYLDSMGMHSDTSYKKRSRDLLVHRFNLRYPSRLKRSLARAWYFILDVLGPRILSGVYRNDDHLFDYSHLLRLKHLAAVWKSDTLSGKEFIRRFSNFE